MNDFTGNTLSYIYDLISEGIWDWDIPTGIVNCSKSWAILVGHGNRCFTTNIEDWKSNIHPDDKQTTVLALDSYLSDQVCEYKVRYRYKHADGHYLWLEDSAKIVEYHSDGSPARMMGAVKDISIEHQLEQLVIERTKKLQEEKATIEKKLVQVEYNASFDVVTGLYNRRSFENTFALEVSRASRYGYALSIILLDIDNFKSFNDVYGHKVGDDMLIALAKLLSKHVRKYDVVARWGGEEFAIILPNTHKNNAAVKAENLRKLIETNLSYDNQTLTCSFGVTTLNDTDNQNSVFVRADKALYLAKNNNRNNVKVI